MTPQMFSGVTLFHGPRRTNKRKPHLAWRQERINNDAVKIRIFVTQRFQYSGQHEPSDQSNREERYIVSFTLQSN